ncbi:hypothetical protein PanWU01x14_239730 [Parasponia andersonii]|uniref:Uncharacterized protein n=1 Tax=Parasponia andersonii TaxID=3476 RepID=A0A2P5BH49_PARAD|nr:hypothetical protein PanWU01x14_239730 [Parasponia andersonii]
MDIPKQIWDWEGLGLSHLISLLARSFILPPSQLHLYLVPLKLEGLAFKIPESEIEQVELKLC